MASVLAVIVFGPIAAWAQTPVVPPGTGMEGDPYRISVLGHLVWMGDTVGASSGKYYAVQNDLDATETATWNGGSGFAPIGGNGTPFEGTLKGNHRTIRSLYIDRAALSELGLFGFLGVSGRVHDLILQSASITGDSYVGGIVGWNQGEIRNSRTLDCGIRGNTFIGGIAGISQLPATLVYCRANGSLKGMNIVGGLVGENSGVIDGSQAQCDVIGGDRAGGLVGANYGVISRCSAAGTVKGVSDLGGLLGRNHLGAVSNCYAVVTVSGLGYAGGLVGINDGTLAWCYAAGQVSVTGAYPVGGLVANVRDRSAVVSCFWDIDTTGQSTSAGGGTGHGTVEMLKQSTFVGWDFENVWGLTEGVTYPVFGVVADAPAGAGTANDPYRISTLAHLLWMAEQVGGSAGKRYVVQNDIDASATAIWNSGVGFVPIGNPFVQFQGQFHGNGKTIGNLYINLPAQDYVGLFGMIHESGVAKDLSLVGGSVRGKSYAGSLAGWNYGAVSNCQAASVVIGSNYVGGLLGNHDRGTVSDCRASGAVTGSRHVGGLVGFNSNSGGPVIRSFATGTVRGHDYVGGLIGDNGVPVSGCYATGAVTGSNYVGGLMGWSWAGSVSNCYASGAVTGSNYVGGLVGYNISSILSSCYATGDVLGSGVENGGLVGFNSRIVEDCYSTGSVTGTGVTGGLVGHNSNDSVVRRCTSAGAVSGTDQVGGLVGYNNLNARIVESWTPATATVHASGRWAGGLLGYSNGAVSNCYSSAAVTGTQYVGGLVGYSYGDAFSIGSISFSFASGSVTGSVTIGGLVGGNSGVVNASFWDLQTTGQASSSGGTGRTTAQMIQKATFAGWDFIRIWKIKEGISYPSFKMPGRGVGDYNTDGQTDLAVFNVTGGHWYIRTLAGAVVSWADQWGWSTAWPVVGDYNGDGQFDQAVFDTQGGYWYIKTLAGGVISWANQWGWSTAKPVPGDYNGDGTWDQAVFDTAGGYWYIKTVGGGVLAWANQWGWSTAKPVPGDYNGDGTFDQAVFDTQGGYWYIKTLAGGVITWANQWGWSTAKPVPGDYDGDGTFDQAVFDTAGGYWYIKTLTGGVITWANQWGWSTAKPVSGDFDGDGVYDLAVYDTAQNLWYIKSLDGRVLVWGGQWGFPGCRRPTLGD